MEWHPNVETLEEHRVSVCRQHSGLPAVDSRLANRLPKLAGPVGHALPASYVNSVQFVPASGDMYC